MAMQYTHWMPSILSVIEKFNNVLFTTTRNLQMEDIIEYAHYGKGVSDSMIFSRALHLQ